MSDRFEKRIINGKEIMNPFRNECTSEHIIESYRHESKSIIERLLWVEDDNKNLQAKVEKLEARLKPLLKFEHATLVSVKNGENK